MLARTAVSTSLGLRAFTSQCSTLPVAARVDKRWETTAANITRLTRLMSLGDELASSTPVNFVPSLAREAFKSGRPTMHTRDELGDLPTMRKMRDSFVQMELRFSESQELREQYVGGSAQVRMGRLMEDFDLLAGTAAYRHVLPDKADRTDGAAYDLYIVTAAVDRMDMLTPLADIDGHVPDLRLSGHVSYVTESSLEVFMRMSTIPKSPSEASTTIMLGRFAMACRSTLGGKHKIAQLEIESEAQQELFDMGKEMRDGMRKRKLESLEKKPPTAHEAKLMHDVFVGQADIYKRNAPTPKDVVWMSDTEIKSALMMHPSERNVHNKIFGGYLMRLSYETAYSTACLFARSPVTFLALDELQFALPVEIGSLLTLESKVTFSPIQGEHRSFHVSVEVGTTDLHTEVKHVTNTFHFTFSSKQHLSRHVLPRSYRQAMQWLDAQRRREHGISVRRAYAST